MRSLMVAIPQVAEAGKTMAAMRNPGAVSNGYNETPGDGETLLRSGLSLRHMRMIAALDDHGRVSAAAQVMNISQPAASRMIADPIRLLMCSAISDGAAAVVLSRKPGRGGVRIRASALTSSPWRLGSDVPGPTIA
eukprot:gene68254-93513_t